MTFKNKSTSYFNSKYKMFLIIIFNFIISPFSLFISNFCISKEFFSVYIKKRTYFLVHSFFLPCWFCRSAYTPRWRINNILAENKFSPKLTAQVSSYSAYFRLSLADYDFYNDLLLNFLKLKIGAFKTYPDLSHFNLAKLQIIPILNLKIFSHSSLRLSLFLINSERA